MTSGHQLDWDLQRRVGLIFREVYVAGPDAVAAEIAKIEEPVDLLHQVTELKAKLLEVEA